EIDVFYFEKPYYVVPADDLAEEAFIVLREALRQSGKVGSGQISVRGRETLVSLKPCGKGIVLETLRYEDEVRKAQSYFKDIPDTKPAKELLDLATTLIEQRAAKFDPGEFHDRYVEALKKLIEKKQKAKGKKVLEDVEEPETARGSNVIDLMAALKKSVGTKDGGGAARPSSKQPAASKAPAKKAAAKKAAPARKRAWRDGAQSPGTGPLDRLRSDHAARWGGTPRAAARPRSRVPRPRRRAEDARAGVLLGRRARGVDDLALPPDRAELGRRERAGCAAYLRGHRLVHRHHRCRAGGVQQGQGEESHHRRAPMAHGDDRHCLRGRSVAAGSDRRDHLADHADAARAGGTALVPD